MTGRRIIAADLPGDAGFTVVHRRMRHIADIADWLDELIGNLELHQPALAGHSYGGWIALGAAVLRPERLGPVTVIAPASGLVPFHWYMALFLRVAEYLPFRPSAASVLRAQAASDWHPDPDFVALMEAMTRHLRTEVPFPVPFDAAFLARIARPIQVVLGGANCSMIWHGPQRVRGRYRESNWLWCRGQGIFCQ